MMLTIFKNDVDNLSYTNNKLQWVTIYMSIDMYISVYIYNN